MPVATQKFYLTTPIYYVNARPHIGHAYTTIVADVIARRHRLLGHETFFLTGTDEHGQKIERSANAAGIPPTEFADEVSASFRALWDRMGITYDDFLRTTEPRHKAGVQRLFKLLQDRGYIYLSTYTGQYCVSDEAYVDGPGGVRCPDCGRVTETVSESNYYFKLSAFQQPLIDQIESSDTSAQISIQPESRRNEVLSFLRSGLKDLSISRTSFKWGIPVPGDEAHVVYVWLDALANYMTAIGYGSDDPADVAKFERFWPADLHLVGKEIIRFHCVYWPAFLMAAGLPLPKAVTAHGWLLFEESKMSKSRGNIVRAETILDGFGEQVYARQFPESTKVERDLFASDVLRYFLLREIPFGQDGGFSFGALIQRYNSDLANGYGNLVSRTLKLIEQSCSGEIPERHASVHTGDETGLRLLFPVDDGMSPYDFRVDAISTTSIFADCVARSEFSIALGEVWSYIAKLDGFVTRYAPWKLTSSLVADDAVRLNAILYTAAESIRIITALLYPVLPEATAKVWSQLGLGDIGEAAREGRLRDLSWGGLEPGTKLGPLAPIFPRADKGLAQTMNDMEQSNAPTASRLSNELTSAAPDTASDPTHPAAPPRTSAIGEAHPITQVAGSGALTTERELSPSHTEARASGLFATRASAQPMPIAPVSTEVAPGAAASAQITIDEFAKVELRVARVLVAERIPKADKLLRLEVDLGYERRQILSGIAEWYTPEELVGRKIVVITNLAPRKMRGLESHGMLLAASSGENGRPALATFAETDAIEVGARLK